MVKNKKTILFGGSGFLGNIFLREYPDIISVGRREPGQGRDNSKHVYCTMDDLSPLDDINFDNVIFLVGNSNHHQINSNWPIRARLFVDVSVLLFFVRKISVVSHMEAK